ncbi:MAG: Epoxide hydrolase domain protein [Actinomycetia bacterium]|nr:Epoxide hydrolase domain protein [Actinomycetes bacterium]
MSGAVVPFRIQIADADLDDLRDRLRRTRWVDAETVDRSAADPVAADPWYQGVPLAYMQELCAYWADGYDWRARETGLNRYPQFRTTIDGLGIHFFHERSPHPEAVPLLLTHGWPGSVVEFQTVIGPLTDPTGYGGDSADAFHVVCPSLPGYGFSERPTESGWNLEHIARAWAALMGRLGYEEYIAQGGDWGAMVTHTLGAVDSDHLLGVHLNMPLAPPDPSEVPTPEERAVLDRRAEYDVHDSGYAKLQGTRPQTLGYGLVDSPAMQAAWIVEKIWNWADHDHDLTPVLDRDQILDNVMLYWLGANGASAGRIYWETAQGFSLPDVTVPVGCSIFPAEHIRTSRRWAEKRFPTLAYWNEPPRGGHFAAWEQPELFVDEMRAFRRVLAQ